MVWPFPELRQAPPGKIADGYSVRTFQPGDEKPFLYLMSAMDLTPGTRRSWNTT